MPAKTRQEEEKIQIFSSDSSPPRKRDHQQLPTTQNWIHWIRTKGCKKNLNDKELLAELQKLRFTYCEVHPKESSVLCLLTKGILAGPKKSKMGFCYQISRRGDVEVRAYFSQKDPRNPDQEIAPEVENLTGSKYYQAWSETAKKTVLYLGIAITDKWSERRGSISIENGALKLRGITFQGLLKALAIK